MTSRSTIEEEEEEDSEHRVSLDDQVGGGALLVRRAETRGEDQIQDREELLRLFARLCLAMVQVEVNAGEGEDEQERDAEPRDGEARRVGARDCRVAE